VDSVLHRIEALPGSGRYAITFTFGAGVEQSAVAQVSDGQIVIAPASLPPDWQNGSAAYEGLVAVLLAFDRTRHLANAPAELLDVDGGWDVMIGNVVLDGGVVTCASHGPMALHGDIWVCEDPNCGARAIYAG
jgi:hypothetical protein